MKKIILILVVALMAMTAAFAQFDAGNDVKGLSPWRLSAYAKDFIIPIQLTELAADTILTETRSFMVPEAAELMRAFFVTSDTTVSGTYCKKIIVRSNAGATADTAVYDSLGNNNTAGFRLRYYGSATRRAFSSREVGVVTYDTCGALDKPWRSTLFLLFRPKSYPTDADSMYKR